LHAILSAYYLDIQVLSIGTIGDDSSTHGGLADMMVVVLLISYKQLISTNLLGAGDFFLL
jgi:hypothetical protein